MGKPEGVLRVQRIQEKERRNEEGESSKGSGKGVERRREV